MKAGNYLQKAADLVGGDRDRQHGAKRQNHRNIADLWSGYLNIELNELDVALMMVLLKVARTRTGAFNPDDYIDMAGYAGIAGELAHEDYGVCVPVSQETVLSNVHHMEIK